MIKYKDVKRFIIQHRTYDDFISIPDNNWVTEWLPATRQKLVQQQIKNRFSYHQRKSMNILIFLLNRGYHYDRVISIMKGIDIIKLSEIEGLKIRADKMPVIIRVRNWGYKEPNSVGELLSTIQKNTARWKLVYENSLRNEKVLKKEKLRSHKRLSEVLVER